MAVRLICDGCRKVSEGSGDYTERGYVLTKRRHYCPECDTIVKDHMRLRDELHTRLAQMWTHELGNLRAQFYSTNTVFFLLPDEDPPDAKK